MRWTLSQVAEATGGRLCDASKAETLVEGVTQDSREAGPGMLFVPLIAERDGHEFIADATAAGAAGYLTSQAPNSPAAPAVLVSDTYEALRRLAAAARSRLADTPVVGITGSVGKTTTKDLIAATAGRSLRVRASRRSFNNEIGVPITVLSAPEDTEALVVEMGARGAGHIAGLCALAQPTMGVVTTVGMAHAGEFGTLEAIVDAKSELVESLPSAREGGVAFLNAGVAEVVAMAERTQARVVTFGEGADVSASGLTLDDELMPSFRLHSPWGEVDLSLGARGAHSVDDALAAAAVALELGVSLEEVAAGLAEPVLSPLRMELLRTGDGARLVNDCYNAGPLSMEAALRSLAALPARRRIAVLGPMAELGDFSAGAHASVAALAASLGISVIAVDAGEYGAEQVRGAAPAVVDVADIEGALAALSAYGELGTTDAVLVKGSRVAGLERLVERLAAKRPRR